MALVILHFDLHNLILSFLEPLDIIALRKTCKVLCDATSQRIVWLYALEKMCYENTVYLPTYPTDKMSVKELEYVTTAPVRWGNLAYECSLDADNDNILASYAMAYRIRQGNRRYNNIPPRVFLVPGGRFLFTLVNGYLSAWDLGYIKAPHTLVSSSLEPICRIFLPRSSNFSVHPSRDGLSIRVLTYNIGYSYKIWEIFPSERNAKFVTIASLTISSPYELHFTSICGDLLVLVYGPIVKVWNFITQGWATWRTPCSRWLQNLVTHDGMLFIGDATISVYDMPKLLSNAHIEVLKPEPDESNCLPPRRSLSFPAEIHPVLHFCGCVSDWYTGSPQPLWFDAIRSARASVGFETHFTCSRSKAELGPPDEILQVPAEYISDFEILLLYQDAWSPYRVCGSNVIFLYTRSNEICCHVGPSSPLPSDTQSFTISLLKIAFRSALSQSFDFCPVSGRLATYSMAGVDGDAVIRVYNYLSTPVKAPSSN